MYHFIFSNKRILNTQSAILNIALAEHISSPTTSFTRRRQPLELNQPSLNGRCATGWLDRYNYRLTNLLFASWFAISKTQSFRIQKTSDRHLNDCFNWILSLNSLTRSCGSNCSVSFKSQLISRLSLALG